MGHIHLKHIRKSYPLGDGKLLIVKGISFDIDEGEFVAIMGASGSGKSTLLHILGCMDHRFEGEFLLDGQPIHQLTPNALTEIRRLKIGFIFQMFNLIQKLTVLENVQLPLIYNRASHQKNIAEALLKKVGLEHRLDHYPNQLSGGECQRVAIARSLVNQPSVILADEPTGNLDSKSGLVVMDMIHQLHQEGKTMILVTHDRKVAEQAQRIIHIKDGLIEGIEIL